MNKRNSYQARQRYVIE